TSYTFAEPLEEETEYFWKVVAKNSTGTADDSEIWSFTTTTSPIISSFPFIEGFEGGNVHNSTTIQHWTQERVTGTNDWTINETFVDYNRTPRTGNYNVTLKFNSSAWMFRPIELEANTVYTFEMWARQDVTAGANLKVCYGDSPTATAMTNIIIDTTPVINGDYQLFVGTFSADTDGIYHLGILGTTTITPWYISLDDIKIYEAQAVAVSGQVNANGAGLAGATVKLEGSLTYETTTNTSGAFSFAEVNADETYTIKVTKEHYATYTAEVVVGDNDLVIPAINMEVSVLAPTDVVAVASDTQVNLTWEAPGSGEATWFTHALDDEFVDAIGTGGAAQFEVAHRYSPTHLANFGVAGATLTAVQFMPAEASASYTVKIYNGGSVAGPGTLVHSQVVPSVTIEVWNEVILTEPVTIPTNAELWIGIAIDTPTGYPAGCDDGLVVTDYGEMMYFGGSWSTLYDLAGINANWMIKGGAVGGTGRTTFAIGDETRTTKRSSIGNISSTKTAFTKAPQSIKFTDNTNTRTRALTGYNVWRSPLASVPQENTWTSVATNLTDTNYTDLTWENVDAGEYMYIVKAVYNGTILSDAALSNVVVKEQGGDTPSLYPPQDLRAEVIGSDVTLAWDEAGAPTTWITHSGMFGNNSVGTNSAADFDVAQRFSAAQLSQLGVAGGQLLKVKFVPHEPAATYTVKVWTGGSVSGSSYNPGTLAVSQVVTGIEVDAWNTVTFDTPIDIPENGEIWFGYNNNTPGGYPAGVDAGPAVDGFGNLLNMGGWGTLVEAGLNYNWCIEGLASTVERQLVRIDTNTIPTDDEILPRTTHLTGMFDVISFESNNTASTRDLIGYKVYRNGTLLTSDAITTLTYLDADLEDGEYTYEVTAVYDEGESDPASVTVEVNANYAITEFPWNEGFEGSFLPMGWLNIDADGDGYKWKEMAGAEYTHSGEKCASSSSYDNTAGPLTPDNWLISPKLSF
ncbi:MAG: choice-of-anchor J domain-containing protein, partial [Bacteroidales bacterium]|nr:choice-of-anchor J domain-containing protein [Bacteroidales bacterium]